MNYLVKQIPKLLFLIFLLLGCSPEKEVNDNLIVGRWELDEAMRDGQRTTLLEGIYFEFYEDGSLKTNFNLSGAETTSKYELSGNFIQQSESDLNLDYLISEINDTALVLNTELRGAKFEILLKKITQEE